MEKRTLAVLSVLLFLVGLCIMARPVRADWSEGDPAKWVQLPDLTSNGVAVWTGNAASLYLIVADDFKCPATGPITDVHIWGSYLADAVWNLDYLQFRLGIWSDIPADQGTISHPGVPLWTMQFNPGDYTKGLYQTLTNPEFFMDPLEPKYLLPGDKEVWQFNFSIAPKDAFEQTEGTIYWLSVETINFDNKFGWKSSDPSGGWNDDAVWALSGGITPWDALKYLDVEDEPLYPYPGESMNMAFVITTTPIPLPGSVLLLGTGLLGLGALGSRRKRG